LEKELATDKSKLPELKNQEGSSVLIHGEEVVDFFSTYEDAIKSGYQKYKMEPFLVKRVQATEPVFFISRTLSPIASKQMSHFTRTLSPQGALVSAAIMVSSARQQIRAYPHRGSRYSHS
jgi:hypothetical protein